jgi:hypothetical protein
MKRLVLLPILGLCIQGCAVVDMPTSEGANPSWVEERLNAGAEPRRAPVTVPEPTITRGETREMDQNAEEILELRSELEIAAAAADPSGREPDEFIATAQQRTTPPEMP